MIAPYYAPTRVEKGRRPVEQVVSQDKLHLSHDNLSRVEFRLRHETCIRALPLWVVRCERDKISSWRDMEIA